MARFALMLVALVLAAPTRLARSEEPPDDPRIEPEAVEPHATVVFATDGTAPAITTALAALGDGGGVVVIPPGEWAWEADEEVRVSTSNVTLLGVGADQTLLYRSSSRDNVAFFRVREAHDVRVSGLRFKGIDAEGNADKDYGVFLHDAMDFRVDHCTFSYLGFAGVRTLGASRGVVDHCQFSRHYKPPVGSYGYGVAVYGSNEYSDEPFGSGEATFVEDSEMALCRHAVASNKAGRYVFRHNRVTASTKAHAIDAHGQEFSSDGSLGTEWIVVHDNVAEDPDMGNTDSPRKYAVRIRGGKALVFDNTFADVHEGVRVDEFTPQDTGPVHVWGNTLVDDPNPRRLPSYCMRIRARDDQLCARKVGPAKRKAPADGVPEFSEEAPAGYTPYPYPHPLVSQLVIDVEGSPLAAEGTDVPSRVWLKATVTVPDARSVAMIRWIWPDGRTQRGEEIEVEDPGATVVIEAVRDDGLVSHHAIELAPL